jgi:hypothetical protein
MARWKEPIAKVCNKEMKTTGHFWEARFGCRELLDGAAVASCSIYVDLNQIRAGLADSLEESQYSAIYRRILAAKQREAELSREDFAEDDPEGLYAFSQAAAEMLYADCFLAPITADGPLLTADSLRVSRLQPCRALEVPPESSQRAVVEQDTKVDEEQEETSHRHGPEDPAAAGDAPVGKPSSSPASSGRPRRPRASDAAIMDIPWPEYLRVVNAVAALTSTNQQSSAAIAMTAGEQLEETLTRWGVNPQAWLVQLEHLDNRCTRALGAAHRMAERAADMAQRWLQGIRLCREIFTDTDTSPPGARSDEFT